MTTNCCGRETEVALSHMITKRLDPLWDQYESLNWKALAKKVINGTKNWYLYHKGGIFSDPET